MATFHIIALIFIFCWLLLVVIRFRRSGAVLVGGLIVIGLYALISLAFGFVTLDELGLAPPHSWLVTLAFALGGLAAMLAYSPLADRLASIWIKEPPNLDAFAGIQQSAGKLIAGILAAWALGGFLEELVARGIVLNSLRMLFGSWLSAPLSAALAILIAAAGAGLMHLYQGQRAVLIIAQLSLLFGALFVVSGYNLWAVMICHGLYDTIAFIRFARKKSRYSR